MPSIRSYPSGVEYREALYNTNLCFRDPGLRGGIVAVDSHGMPKPISGAFASVFTVQGASSRRWAVKCFTRIVDHQALRYERISEALRGAHRTWQVEFDYLPEGVLCQGNWFPVLKMEWIEAMGLIPYIDQHLWEPGRLANLANRFASLTNDLASLGIAHGDLQHGNLLVASSGDLKLIDYDGMYVPSLASMGTCEKGHVNYQSPSRTMNTWGPDIDNFSAWVIYASLIAIAIEPSLWTLLRSQGDEALLFKQDDFLDQATSRAFQVLSQSREPDLRALSYGIKALWSPDVSTVPPLDPGMLPTPSTGPSATSSPQPSPAGSPAAARLVPDWVTQAQTGAHTGSPASSNGPGWIAGHLPALPLVEFHPSRLGIRVLAGLELAAVMITAIIGGIYSGSDTLISLGAGIVLLSFIMISFILFRRTDGWKDRRSSLLVLKDRRSEASSKAREVSKLEITRREIQGREEKEAGRATKHAEKAKSSEQKELSDASKALQGRIGNIERQKQRLAKSESSEISNTLRSIQRDHAARYLSSHLITSAQIPGIGQGVAHSLAANGIRSAADFTGIQYQVGPRGGQQILLRTPHGLVHPSGVGEKKARDLESWRRGVEFQATRTQPTTLPAPRLQAIRAKYLQQGQALADQEQAARAQAAQGCKEISAKWASTHARIASELTATRLKFGQERRQIDNQMTSARKEADTALWQRQLTEREVAAYQKVKYRRFLLGIFKS
jgi:hypothetical protein